MNPYMMIIDDFLERPMALRDIALAREYKDTQHPDDGQVYPDICPDVPYRTKLEVEFKLETIFGRPIEEKYMIFRKYSKGYKAKYIVHTDSISCQYVLLLYLTLPEFCTGGTAFLEHVSGMKVTPVTAAGGKLWMDDCNDLSKWNVVTNCDMRFNRGCIVRADVFHAGMPLEHVHDDPNKQKLILSVFFNVLGRN